MRGRIPKPKDILRTIQGIIQSTAFLTTSAFSYSAYLCALGKVFGGYNFFTASYIPAFMSSFTGTMQEMIVNMNFRNFIKCVILCSNFD